MKKVFALLLVFALVMSLGVSAFAEVKSPVSPASEGSSAPASDGGYTEPVAPVATPTPTPTPALTPAPAEEEKVDEDADGDLVPDALTEETDKAAEGELTFDVVDAKDEAVAAVPASEVTIVPVKAADQLPEKDKEAFLKAYEEAKAVQDKVVKYFFWVDIPESYKSDSNFDAMKFTFTCTGDNVVVLVNGKPVKLVKLDGNKYVAYLTEFGAISILTDIEK